MSINIIHGMNHIGLEDGGASFVTAPTLHSARNLRTKRNRDVAMVPLRIMSYGRKGLDLALKYGCFAGARYTNLRTIRGIRDIGLIDIDWKNYDFDRHLEAVKIHRPNLTVAMDILSIRSLPKILLFCTNNRQMPREKRRTTHRY